MIDAGVFFMIVVIVIVIAALFISLLFIVTDTVLSPQSEEQKKRNKVGSITEKSSSPQSEEQNKKNKVGSITEKFSSPQSEEQNKKNKVGFTTEKSSSPQFIEISKDTQKEWRRQNGITEPSESTSLMKKQKYAIVGLMAYVQGASPLSIFDEDAKDIVHTLFASLGLSKQEIEAYLKQSMLRDGEDEANDMIDTLHTITDKDYLRRLYRKALTVARISESKETIENVRHIFGELNI